MPIIVKPVESAGSDGVKLCHTREEAEAHFHLLMKAQKKVGSQGAAVLCQEFLCGKEYVVDHVSSNGEHKTTAIWVYDKRPANGSAFVYFGMKPVASDSAEALKLVPYVRGVLDALQIKNGATHGEVMMTETGPCLVEMNCRTHGGDGSWVPLAKALTGGYSQVDATLDAFLDARAFQTLPDVPPAPFRAAASKLVTLRSSANEAQPEGTAVTGTWRDTEYYEVEESKNPPEPEGAAPPKEDDGAYASKAYACDACKFAATGSCAMFKTCVCYATNSHFELIGLPDNADKDNWKWACGNTGGDSSRSKGRGGRAWTSEESSRRICVHGYPRHRG